MLIFDLPECLIAISPSNSLEISPIFFGGPPTIVTGNRPRDFHLKLHRLARFFPLFCFFVKLRRDRRRAAILREPADHDEVVVGPDPDSERITDLELLGALGPLAIDLDFSGLDCGRGDCPRLEKTRGP